MNGPGGVERRRAERRVSDRRRLPRFTASESWREQLDEGWREHAVVTDAAALAEGRAGDAAELEAKALPRLLRTYIALRGVLGTILLLAPWLGVLLRGHLPLPMLAVCLAYAGQAISLWVLPELAGRGRPARDRLSRTQWIMTIGVDVVAFSLLRLLDQASQLNYAALLVLPVLMAGVLTRRLAALATAAVVALVLLTGVSSAAANGGDVMLLLSQAGLAGAGLFAIALLASELSLRLASEEQAARGNMELARQQAQLARVVIEEMAEGVLVVDRHGAVRALNPAAQHLLRVPLRSASPPFALAIEPAWAPLGSAIDRAFIQGLWPEDSREIELQSAGGDGALRLQVRARFTRRSGIGTDRRSVEDFCVLFLEDVRVAQARTRQEKLASMGRMSAGIAHEIRNPLAAIAQANALLLEDGLSAGSERLAHIVEDNVARLKRIVDDVMAVAAVAERYDTTIDIVAETSKVCDEWCHAHSTVAARAPADGSRVRLDLPASPLGVLFDPEHLRRVLINLLDNAGRHASVEPGAIVLKLRALARVDAVELTVASDGPPIASEVERHLFEPFFSTRARGSGLGLYICRELCERHRSSIEFRLAPAAERHRNGFRILMPRAVLP